MSLMIISTSREGSRIRTTITGEGLWRNAIDADKKSAWWTRVAAGEVEYFVEYSDDFDAPDSVAVIPALVNLLPLAWLTDTTVVVDEIDAHFAAAIPFIKARYQKLYPELPWQGAVEWSSQRYEHIGQARGQPLSMFSGGVDAVFTALANIALEPTLTTIWGADMFFHDVEGWQRVRQANQDFADRLGLQFLTIKSSLRTSINYSYLDPEFGKPVKDNWWHAFQFGPSLSSLGLPMAFSQKSDTIFLASDYSKKDPFVNRSASDAALVQEIRAGGSGVKCHDFNFSRQDKVRFICEFSRTHPDIDIPLRVCWQSGAAENCGKCEKCLRTEFAIMSCNSDPAEFGFDMSDAKQDEILEVLSRGTVAKTAFWKQIVSDLRQSRFAESRLVRALLETQA